MIVERQIRIAAPINLVFGISQDYAVRYEWDPFPEKIMLLNDAREIAIGTIVRVLAKSGMQMDVQFVQLDPPRRAAVTMIAGPGFLQKFAGSWIFHADSENATTVTFRYAVKVKACMLPPIGNRIAAWYFGRQIQNRLAGLKRYCEARALQTFERQSIQ